MNFGLVSFEKIETFHIQDSSKISNLYVKTKCKQLLDCKIDIIIKNEHYIIIINVGAKLSEYDNGERPILKDVNGIFRQTKSVTISISGLVDSKENLLVNEFSIET